MRPIEVLVLGVTLGWAACEFLQRHRDRERIRAEEIDRRFSHAFEAIGELQAARAPEPS